MNDNTLNEFQQALEKCQSIVSTQLQSIQQTQIIDWRTVQQQLDTVVNLVSNSTQEQQLVVLNNEKKEELFYGNFDAFFRMQDVVFHIVCFFNRNERKTLCLVNHTFKYCATELPLPVTRLDLLEYDITFGFIQFPMSFERVSSLCGRAQENDGYYRYYDGNDEYELESAEEDEEFRLLCSEKEKIFEKQEKAYNFDTVFMDAIARKNVFSYASNFGQQPINMYITRIDATIPRRMERIIANACPRLQHISVLTLSSLNNFPNLTSVDVVGYLRSNDQLPMMQNLSRLVVFNIEAQYPAILKSASMNCPNLEIMILGTSFGRDRRTPSPPQNLGGDINNNDSFASFNLPPKLKVLGVPYFVNILASLSIRNLEEFRVMQDYYRYESVGMEEFVANNSSTLTSLKLPLQSLYTIELPASLTSLELHTNDVETVRSEFVGLFEKCKNNLKHLHLKSTTPRRYRRDESVHHTWKLPVLPNLETLSIVPAVMDFKLYPKLHSVKLYGTKAAFVFASDSLEYIDLSDATIYNVILDTPKLRLFKPSKSMISLECIRTGLLDINVTKCEQFYSMRLDKVNIRKLELPNSTSVLPRLNLSSLQQLCLQYEAAYTLCNTGNSIATSYPQIKILGLSNLDHSQINTEWKELTSILVKFPNIHTLKMQCFSLTVTSDNDMNFPNITTIICDDCADITLITHHFPELQVIEGYTLGYPVHDTNINIKKIRKFSIALTTGIPFPNFEEWSQLERLSLLGNRFQDSRSRSPPLYLRYRSYDDRGGDRDDRMDDYSRIDESNSISNQFLKHLIVRNLDMQITINCPNLISFEFNAFSSTSWTSIVTELILKCKNLEYVDLGCIKPQLLQTERTKRGRDQFENDSDSDSANAYSDYSTKSEQYFICTGRNRRDRNYRGSRSRSPHRDDHRPDRDPNNSSNGNNAKQQFCPLYTFITQLASTNLKLKVIAGFGSLDGEGMATLLQVHEKFSNMHPHVLFSFQNSKI
jgi:hypothetical protein